jgi:hypothetical protein
MAASRKNLSTATAALLLLVFVMAAGMFLDMHNESQAAISFDYAFGKLINQVLPYFTD